MEILNEPFFYQFVQSAHYKNHDETQQQNVSCTSACRSNCIYRVQIVRVRHVISQVPLYSLVHVPIIQKQLPFQLFNFALCHQQIGFKITQRVLHFVLILIIETILLAIVDSL